MLTNLKTSPIMLPQNLIVDTREAVLEFHKHAVAIGEDVNVFTDEILHSLVNCLNTKDHAVYQLMEFAAEVEFGEYSHDNSPVLIHESCAGPIIDLGRVMFQQFQDLQLYNSAGDLLYDYHEFNHDVVGFHDLILQLIEDN